MMLRYLVEVGLLGLVVFAIAAPFWKREGFRLGWLAMLVFGTMGWCALQTLAIQAQADLQRQIVREELQKNATQAR